MNEISVTSAARSKRLCRVHDVKDKLGLSGVGDDAEIERLIAATGMEFAGLLGREPWHQVYRERLPGEGGIYLALSRWPIDNVSSVLENETAVTATDYEVSGVRRDRVYREDGWQFTAVRDSWHSEIAGDKNLTYDVAYTAGWLMPNQVLDWDGGHDYVVGDWVRASDPTITVLFECTVAGESDSAEPSWDTDEGDETTDNEVTWTARGARELPDDLEQAAIMRCVDLYRESITDPLVAAESFDTMRIQYREVERSMSKGLTSLLRLYA